MALKVGFIGAGMMAEALAGGFDKAGVAAFADMSCIDPNQSRMDLFSSWGVTACKDNTEVATRSNVIFIAVKPYTVSQVLNEMRQAGALTKDSLVISIAAGVTLQTLEEAAGPGIPVMRVMPNTPCLVGCVAAAMSAGKACDDTHAATTSKLFDAVGKIHQVDEKLLDAVTGLSGSGPAYIFLTIEAMADGGVLAGVGRDNVDQRGGGRYPPWGNVTHRGGHTGARLRVMCPRPSRVTRKKLLNARGGKKSLHGPSILQAAPLFFFFFFTSGGTVALF